MVSDNFFESLANSVIKLGLLLLTLPIIIYLLEIQNKLNNMFISLEISNTDSSVLIFYIVSFFSAFYGYMARVIEKKYFSE